MRENSLHGNRETPRVPTGGTAGRSEKADGQPSDMHARGESDDRVVPKKQANNDGVSPSAESVEGRRSTKGNALPAAMPRTQSRTGVSIGLQRVREVEMLLRQYPR